MIIGYTISAALYRIPRFAAMWMALEIIILIQNEKDKYVMSLMCRILKNMIQMNLFIKQKDTQTWEDEFMVTGRGDRGGGGTAWEFGIDVYTLLYLIQIIRDFPGGPLVETLHS